jgi:hypothetical protein
VNDSPLCLFRAMQSEGLFELANSSRVDLDIEYDLMFTTTYRRRLLTFLTLLSVGGVMEDMCVTLCVDQADQVLSIVCSAVANSITHWKVKSCKPYWTLNRIPLL